MGLKTPETVRRLQRKLYAKAKEEPEFRFYALYDKVYRSDILEFAHRKCKANGGAPGVDGQSFDDIETYGRERWLGELAEELKVKSYRCSAIRRVWIEKDNGGERPLGVPTIRDRVVQTAAMLVIEPIFEADLEPEQHGYRPRRSATEAVREVHKLISRGHREVVDADLSAYFDTIPHRQLLRSVARRVSDGAILKLIKRWLKAPVREDRNYPGAKGGGEAGKGTPQGSPLSPLLANLYMRRFLKGWKKLGFDRLFGAGIVAYADDFVICCRREADSARRAAVRILEAIGLRLNERKTRIRRLPRESFDFLGYTLGLCHSPKTGKAYLGTRPSKKRIQRFNREIHRQTRAWSQYRTDSEQVERLNRMLLGWANYFCLGPVSRAYRAVDAHTRWRLRQWLRRKHKKQGAKGTRRYPDEHLYEKLKLVRLESRTRNLPWAKA